MNARALAEPTTTNDPVCGMSVNPATAKWQTRCRGETISLIAAFGALSVSVPKGPERTAPCHFGPIVRSVGIAWQCWEGDAK